MDSSRLPVRPPQLPAPVSPVLVWPFQHWLGPTLWVPRPPPSLSTLAVVAAVYGIARALGHARGWAAALAGLALCPWFPSRRGPLARVDMLLAIALSAAGILAFLARGAPRDRLRALLARVLHQAERPARARGRAGLDRSGRAPCGDLRPPWPASSCPGRPDRPARLRHPRRGLPSPRHLHGRRRVRVVAARRRLRCAGADRVAGAAGRRAPARAPSPWPGPRPRRARSCSTGCLTRSPGLPSRARRRARSRTTTSSPGVATVLAPGRGPAPSYRSVGTRSRMAVLILAAAVAHYTDNWAHLLPRAITYPGSGRGLPPPVGSGP